MPDGIVISALKPGANCPDIEQLTIHLAFTADDPLRAAAEAHLKGCLNCRTELQLLNEFEAGAMLPGEADAVKWISSRLTAGQSKREPSPGAGWRRWLSPGSLAGFAAAAAAIILIVGVGPQVFRGNNKPGPVPEFHDEVQRAAGIEVLNTVKGLAWKPLPGVTQYEVSMRTVDRRVIFHDIFTTSVLQVPREAATIVETGRQVWWEVVALDASGNEIARSGSIMLAESSFTNHDKK